MIHLLFILSIFILSFSQTVQAADRVKASYAAVNASQAPLWVAQDRGFFAKYGLEVDLVFISSGSLNVQALVGNTVQFAAGGASAIEARLRGLKLTTISNPLPVAASNLITHPDVKTISDLKGKVGAISRFGSSSDQAIRYLFRKHGLNLDSDLKLLQLGGDTGRLAGLKAGKVQYTLLGAAASEQARRDGFKVPATAQQMAIPFPWTSVTVNESWFEGNRDLSYRYVKAVTEGIAFMKRNRPDSERIIAKYMKISDPKLAALENNFYSSLFPDYPIPTVEGIRLILDNLTAEKPEAARRDAKEFVDYSIVDRLKTEQFVEKLK
jgi:sulfonate transport system substrate-binding protein